MPRSPRGRWRWGADIVNDVGGLREMSMRALLAVKGCTVVAMHSLTVPADPAVTLPPDADPVAAILEWKEQTVAAARRSGIASERLIFDPGLGFGKSAAQSQALVDRAGELLASGGLWLYGHSRKGFLGGPPRRARRAHARLLAATGEGGRADPAHPRRRLPRAAASRARVSGELGRLLAALRSPSLPGIDLSLERMQRGARRARPSEARLPPVVHVAGTNGKGSTIATLRAMLEAAGQRVHVYTSPELVRFHERIVLAGREITDAELIPCLQRVAGIIERIPLTSFEATTAAAFLAFAGHPADMLLLEVGLGGRLDATNVVAAPRAVLLTPISLDHTEFLGNDLASIAAEKGGHPQAGRRGVLRGAAAAALAVIRERAGGDRRAARRRGRGLAGRGDGQRLRPAPQAGALRVPPPRAGGRAPAGQRGAGGGHGAFARPAARGDRRRHRQCALAGAAAAPDARPARRGLGGRRVPRRCA